MVRIHQLRNGLVAARFVGHFRDEAQRGQFLAFEIQRGTGLAGDGDAVEMLPAELIHDLRGFLRHLVVGDLAVRIDLQGNEFALGAGREADGHGRGILPFLRDLAEEAPVLRYAVEELRRKCAGREQIPLLLAEADLRSADAHVIKGQLRLSRKFLLILGEKRQKEDLDLAFPAGRQLLQPQFRPALRIPADAGHLEIVAGHEDALDAVAEEDLCVALPFVTAHGLFRAETVLLAHKPEETGLRNGEEQLVQLLHFLKSRLVIQKIPRQEDRLDHAVPRGAQHIQKRLIALRTEIDPERIVKNFFAQPKAGQVNESHIIFPL